MKKETIRIGSTLHVLLAADGLELECMVSKTLDRLIRPNGESAVLSDGSRVFVEDRAAWTDGEGAARYVWHQDGNRVKCDRVHVTVSPSGIRKERLVRQLWKKYESVC